MSLTRTTDHSEEIDIPMGFADAFDSLVAAYEEAGRVQSVQQKFGRVVGTVGSGHLNMNRATVTVIVKPIDDSDSRLMFKSSAQEGLIQQNTAAKAVTRILEMM